MTTIKWPPAPSRLRSFINLTIRASTPCGSRNYRGQNHGRSLKTARRGIRFYFADIINGVATLPISGTRYATLRSGWQRLPEAT